MYSPIGFIHSFALSLQKNKQPEEMQMNSFTISTTNGNILTIVSDKARIIKRKH